jgi:hypothetical protein
MLQKAQQLFDDASLPRFTTFPPTLPHSIPTRLMTSRILPFLLATALAASAFAQAPATPAAPKTPSPYDEQYKLGPDSQPQAGVPEGKVTEY